MAIATRTLKDTVVAGGNTGATSGDIELSAYGVSGYVILELRKDTTFTA